MLYQKVNNILYRISPYLILFLILLNINLNRVNAAIVERELVSEFKPLGFSDIVYNIAYTILVFYGVFIALLFIFKKIISNIKFISGYTRKVLLILFNIILIFIFLDYAWFHIRIQEAIILGFIYYLVYMVLIFKTNYFK